MNRLQRLFQFLGRFVQFTSRDHQTIHCDFEARPRVRRIDEPRGRVKAESFACHVCRGEFSSFMELRGHVCRPVQG